MDLFRRKLLHLLGFAAALPATSLLESFATSETKEGRPWKAVFRTTFPRDLHWKDYNDIRKSFRNEDLAEDFLESFQRAGKILRTGFAFADTHADWVVIFKDKESAEEWLLRSETCGANDEDRMEALGFRRDLYRWSPA